MTSIFNRTLIFFESRSPLWIMKHSCTCFSKSLKFISIWQFGIFRAQRSSYDALDGLFISTRILQKCRNVEKNSGDETSLWVYCDSLFLCYSLRIKICTKFCTNKSYSKKTSSKFSEMFPCSFRWNYLFYNAIFLTIFIV